MWTEYSNGAKNSNTVGLKIALQWLLAPTHIQISSRYKFEHASALALCTRDIHTRGEKAGPKCVLFGGFTITLTKSQK